MGFFLVWRAEVSVRRQNDEILHAASEGVCAELREFLQRLGQVSVVLGNDPRIVALVSSDKPEAVGNAADVTTILARRKQVNPDILELSVADRNGRVVTSTNPSLIGKDVSAEPYFVRGKESFYPGDVTREGEKGPVEWVMSSPVKDGLQVVEGVVLCRANPDSLSDLMTGRRIVSEGAVEQSFRMGKTGESYIVNRRKLIITESRFIPNAVLNKKVDTRPVRAALGEGEKFTGSYPDYRGVIVEGSSVFFKSRGWVVLTEIDFSQALIPIRRLLWTLAFVAFGLLLVVTTAAGLWVRKILALVEAVKVADDAFLRGEKQAAVVREERLPKDEIGDFLRNRNKRITCSYEQERRLLQEQKRRTEYEAELEVMSYSMVHDMRAPLRSISGFVDVLEEEMGAKLSKKERGYMAIIVAAVRRMDSLVCDILNYSMIVRSELPLRSVDVAKALLDTLQTYPSLHDVADKMTIPPGLPIVRGNEAGLCQCFSCLLENAVKFTKVGKPPNIEIRSEERDGWARIIVEDHGLGIPTEGQKKIFGIFQRGSTSFAGNGMGLALVQKTASRMGGRVGFTSECGSGSKFWIELPLAGNWLPRVPAPTP